MQGADLVNSFLTTIGNLATNVTARFIEWCRDVATSVTNVIKSIADSEEVGIAIVVIMIISVLWFPSHHVVLSITQNAWTCTARPLIANVAEPIIGAMQAPVTMLMQLVNIPLRFQVTFWQDMVLLLLKCNGTTEMILGVQTGFTQLGRSLSVCVRVGLNASLGRTADLNATAIAASTLCDGISGIAFGASAALDCYCAPCMYATDSIGLFFADKHTKCVTANAMTIVLETVTQTIRCLLRCLEYIVDAIAWVLKAIFGSITRQQKNAKITKTNNDGPFPWPNLTYILPTLERMSTAGNALICCSGDLTNDIVNSILAIGSQAISASSGIDFIGGAVSPGTLLKEWHTGDIISGTGPVFIETGLFGWNLARGLMTATTAKELSTNMNNLDVNRLFDSYEAMCVKVSESFEGIFPLENIGKAGLANNTILQNIILAIELGTISTISFTTLLQIPAVSASVPGLISNPAWTPGFWVSMIPLVETVYGNMLLPYSMFPRTIKHTCRSSVHFAHALVSLLRDLPSYDQYTKGGYFNCTLNAYQQSIDQVGAELNNFFDMIPAIPSCRFVTDPGTDIFRISCKESLFKSSIGDLARTTFSLFSTTMNYAVTATEHMHNFSEFWEIPLDQFFDDLNGINTALSHGVQGLIEGVIPLNQFSFTLPQTGVTMYLDRMFGVQEVGPFVESLLNSFVEFGRFSVRTIQYGNLAQWKFDITDLQALLFQQNIFVNHTAQLFGAWGCMFKTAMDDANYQGDRCLYSPVNGICPLDIVFWCDADAFAAPLRAFNQAIMALTQLVMFPNDYIDYVLADSILCELETAATSLKDVFAGINGVNIDISKSWGTNNTIRIGDTIAEFTYSFVKVGTAMNRAVIEIIHAIRRGTDPETEINAIKHKNCINTSFPIWDNVKKTCFACHTVTPPMKDVKQQRITQTATLDSCSVYVQEGSACCHRSGKCFSSGPCYDPTLIADEVTKSIGSMNNAIENLFRPLGVIDTHLMRSMTRFSKSALQVWNAVMKGILVAPYAPKGDSQAFGPTLANAACAFNELGWSVGHAIAVPVSLIGRILGLVATFFPETSTDAQKLHDYQEGMHKLSGSIGAASNALLAITADTFAFGLGSMGALIEGDVSSIRWATATANTACALEEDVTQLRLASRAVVENIDISGDGSMCVGGRLMDSVVEMSTTGFVQVLRAIAIGAYTSAKIPTTSLKRLSFSEPIQAFRRACVVVGITLSRILYYTVHVISTSVADANTKLFDSIGNFVASFLNMFITGAEAVLQYITIIFKKSFNLSIVGENYSNSAPTITLATSVVVFLRSLAKMLNYVWPALYNAFNYLADLVNSLFVNSASPLVIFNDKLTDLVIKTLQMIVGWATGNTAPSAEFVTSLTNLVSYVFTSMAGTIAATLDKLLFGGVVIVDSYGPFSCLVSLPDCAWQFVKTWSSRIWHLLFKRADDAFNMVEYLQLAAVVLPESYGCRDTFIYMATLYETLQLDNATVPSQTIDDLIQPMGTVAGWWFKRKMVSCLMDLSTDPSVQIYFDPNYFDPITVRADRAETIPTVVNVDIFGSSICQQYNSTSTTECTLNTAARVSMVTSAMWQALMMAARTDTESAVSMFADGLKLAGMSTDDIDYYVAMFVNMSKSIGNKTSTTMFELFGDTTVVSDTTATILYHIETIVNDMSGVFTGDNTTNDDIVITRTDIPNDDDDSEDDEIIVQNPWIVAGHMWSNLARDSNGNTIRLTPKQLAITWCGSDITTFASSYSIGSNVDSLAFVGCTDDSEYTDSKGCQLNGPPVPPDPECQTWCPDCKNASRIFVMENPCPLHKRCALQPFSGKTLVDGMCDRICGGPSTSDLFMTMCNPTAIARDGRWNVGNELWALRADVGSRLNALLGVDNLSYQGIANMIDMDFSTKTTNGYLSADDTCTAFGLASRDNTWQFCNTKCNYHNSTTYAARIINIMQTQDNIRSNSELGIEISELNATYTLMVHMCNIFCRPNVDDCEPNNNVLLCNNSVTSGLACLATCGQTWTVGTPPAVYETCTHATQLTCNAISPSTPKQMYDTSCACPVDTTNNNGTYCSCSYSFGPQTLATPTRPKTLQSFCPTLANPIFSFFDNIDYPTMTSNTRIFTTRTTLAVPQFTTRGSTLSSLYWVQPIQYTIPTTIGDVLCPTNNVIVEMTLSLSHSSATVAEKCGYGSWQYDPLEAKYWKPLINECPEAFGTYPNTRFELNDDVDIVDSVVGTPICGTWKTIGFANDCASGVSFDTGSTGLCDSSVCTPESTYLNPITKTSSELNCTRDAHCANGIFDSITCTSDPIIMTTKLCGTVRKPLKFPHMTYMPIVSTDYAQHVYVSGTIKDGKIVGATNWKFTRRSNIMVPCKGPINTVSDNLANSMPIYEFLIAYGKMNDAKYEAAFTANDTKAIIALSSNTQVTFTNAALDASGNPLKIQQTITYANRVDFCSALCPNDPHCIKTMTTGFDCNVYRARYRNTIMPYHGTPYARTWLCMALPLVQRVSNQMFPLQVVQIPSTNSTNTVSGIYTTYSPYSANSCPSINGAYFNNIKNGVHGPQYDNDNCILEGPDPMSSTKDTPLTSGQCANIAQYASTQLTNIYSLIANIGLNDMSFVSNTQPDARRRTIIGRDGQPDQRIWEDRSAITSCNTKNCELGLVAPVKCTRGIPAINKPSKRLPDRPCLYTPHFPCDSCGEMKWVPTNSTDAYFKWLAHGGLHTDNPSLSDLMISREAQYLRTLGVESTDPAAKLVIKIAKLKDLIDTIRGDLSIDDGIKQMIDDHTAQQNYRQNQDTISSTNETDILMSLIFSRNTIAYVARAIEMAACKIAPGSAPCSRLEHMVELHGIDTQEYTRRTSKMTKEVLYEMHDELDTQATMSNAIQRSWYDTIIPLLSDIPTDCYVLCGYNYTQILDKVCAWRVFDRYGIVGEIWDSFMAARAAVCHVLSPDGDGSDRYNGGGPMMLLNKSTVDLNVQIYTKTGKWLDNFFLFRDIKTLLLQAIGKATGVTPRSFAIEELTLTLMAAVTHRNTSNITAEELQNWTFNTNFNSASEDVGLLYYLSIVTPYGVDCPKISGDIRLFGYIPIWNPMWMCLPTWVPEFGWNLTKYVKDIQMIAPDELIKRDGDCRDLREINLPFSNDCGCNAPTFYNCAEKHGFSDPLDSFMFVFNWIAPSIAQSVFVTIPFKVALMGERTEQFRDVTTRSDFDSYVYCFFITSPGFVWVFVFIETLLITFVFVCTLIFIIASAVISLAISTIIAFITWQANLVRQQITNDITRGIATTANNNGDANGDVDNGDEEEEYTMHEPSAPPAQSLTTLIHRSFGRPPPSPPQ